MSTPTAAAPFEVHAPGVDTAALVASIQARVAERMARGEYIDARIARAERTNLLNLKDEEEFLRFYLQSLHDAVFVDISDFEIHERRKRLGRALIALKRGIWTLLKFYTYRLWSQQNQVNGLLLSALESAESRYSEKIRQLEQRVAELEKEAKARRGC